MLIGEREYYERQLDILNSFEKVDYLVANESTTSEEDDEEQAKHERAMKISNYANIILLAFKVIYETTTCLFVFFFNCMFY